MRTKMRRYTLYLALSSICFTILPIWSAGQSLEIDQKLQTFLKVAEEVFQEAALPGVGISIVYQGEIIHSGGFGFSNLERKEPITENSLFFIGSTTKAFTGFAAAKLVDDKKLDWKKPIVNYLPTFKLKEPYVAKHVNLEDLFTHMTGLARKDQLWLGKPLTREQVYQQVENLDFAHSFRGTWDYNNHTYVVIGKVLESVADTTWEFLIENEVFKPLEMINSHTTYQGFINDSKHVTAYFEDGKTEQAHNNSDNIGPAGAISSSPKDISKWLKMLVNKGNFNGKQILSEKEYNYLMGPKGMSFADTCTVHYYSIGWGGIQTQGRRTLIHSGQINGSNSRVLFMPDDGFGIFIMTNQASDYKDILIDYAKSIFVDETFNRDIERESKLFNYNRFMQFQYRLSDNGINDAKTYYNTLKYKDFESGMIRLGNTYLNAGYLDQAMFIFELNVADHPNSAAALYNYANVLSTKGEKEKAIKMYQKSLDIDSSNYEAKYKLNKLLEKSGN